MKKSLMVMTAALTLMGGNAVCAATIPTEVELNRNIVITYNDEVQRFKNVNGDIVYPISYEGTTYLPIRSISCLFETEIEWDGRTNSIYLGKGSLDTIAAESISKFIAGVSENVIVELNQDIKIYYGDEVQTFKDVNGKIVYPLSYNGTTYLPVRAISNLYNAGIEWDGETSTVSITKKNLEDTLKTEVVKLNGYMSLNDNVTYFANINGGRVSIELNASEYGLPANLRKFSKEAVCEITYSSDDYKVQSCNIINHITGEKITDFSDENLRKLYDIEYGKTINDKSWTGQIKLSELTENMLYRYVAPEAVYIPEFINDTGKDCIVYFKNSSDIFPDTYDKAVKLHNNIDYNASRSSYDTIEKDGTLIIAYKYVTTKEILLDISEHDIIRLSKYGVDEEIYPRLQEYIYNDSDKPITIGIKEFSWEKEKMQITIEANKIYGFDSTIHSITKH